jgi:hypothetical protein
MIKDLKEHLKILFCVEFLILFVLGTIFCMYKNAANEAFENHVKFDDEYGLIINNVFNNSFKISNEHTIKMYFIDENHHILKITHVETNNKENIHYTLTSNAITLLPVKKNNIAVYLENGQIMHLNGISSKYPLKTKHGIFEIQVKQKNITLSIPLMVDKENGQKIKNDFQQLAFNINHQSSLFLALMFLTFAFFSIIQVKIFLIIKEQKNVFNYGLNPEQIEFLKHLTYLDKEERFKALSNIEFNSNNLAEFNDKLDFELTLFNKVYNEKSKFYKNIFDSNDFGNICFILNYEYNVTDKHKKQADIILKQQQNFDCLMDEIKNVSPVQYEKSLTINIDEFFGKKEMENIPFIQYTDLSKHINNNQKIINELKNIRFDCVFQ